MWHPKDEAEATSEQAAFIEWLRATREDDTLNPPVLLAWSASDPLAFAAAWLEFRRDDK